ncbi:hypothetical protein GGR54DRAFT_617390 [Hypoxylon sp. NC1633]|nr:hypothetical protein GGR54DRAFT_617390 [Hypoxylon sp. NC1633]
MQKRRSHKKSRNGCQNCKKWHTKCDEQGPPCNNCALRKAKCVYNRPKNDGVSQSGALTIHSKGREATTYRAHLERPQGNVGSLCASYGGPSRLMELELMHQWSTNTYKTFCGIPEDIEYMQVILPRASLNYDYMLNCILAVSSLHIAASVGEAESARYVTAALEFYNRGSMSFRNKMGTMNSENTHALYMFSALAGAVHMSIPRRTASVLEQVIVAFDLVIGSTSVALMGYPWLLDSPFPIQVFMSRMGASHDWIDADDTAALARLRSINDQLHKSTSEPNSDTEEERGRVGIVRDHELYDLVISNLETCFAEESRGLLRGFATAFPGQAGGKQFASRLNKSNPFALLLIMHWAVLINRLDDSFWWATSAGRGLVAEILDLLRTYHPLLLLEWEDAINYVVDQVTLPASQSRALSLGVGSVEIVEEQYPDGGSRLPTDISMF